jgi:hypothetical protein
MVSLFDVYVAHTKTLLFGMILFLLRCMIENKNPVEIVPYIKNKYFLLYIFFLWFGIFAGLSYYFQLLPNFLFVSAFGDYWWIILAFIVCIKLLIVYIYK